MGFSLKTLSLLLFFFSGTSPLAAGSRLGEVWLLWRLAEDSSGESALPTGSRAEAGAVNLAGGAGAGAGATAAAAAAATAADDDDEDELCEKRHLSPLRLGTGRRGVIDENGCLRDDVDGL